MQITNYWNQPQAQQNKAFTSAASTMDFLNTLGKGSDSNNSGTTDASQSALAGASMVTSFSASLAAANVDTASTGSYTSTSPDFTHMTDHQMLGWVNSQIASGQMTGVQAEPFFSMTLNTPAQEFALTGNTTGAVNSTGTTASQPASNTTNTPVFHNFINLAQQYISSDDQAAAKLFKPALDLMSQLQGQSSQDIGADLSLRNLASKAQSQTASQATTSASAASTGTATSTNPDFTNMSDNQMSDWVISQVASGAMTKEQSSPFLTLALRMQDSPLTGGNIGNTTVPHNFIDEAKQYVASEDHATARFIKPALDTMLKLQSQTSQGSGTALSPSNSLGTTQSQTASQDTTAVDAASTGTSTLATPDFTNMTRQQMRDWVNEQIKSGKMTFDQSSPFVGMSSDISVSKGFINVATDTTRVNFIENTQQGIAGALSRGDQVEAKQLQAALSAMLAAQGHNSQDASQSQTGSGSRVVEVGWLTASDVKLIQQTTGQTIDPSTGNAYDSNGQRVALSQSATSLANTLSTIRSSGISNSNGSATMINGDITTADLHNEMQFFASDPEGLTGTNNFSAVTQAISVLNGHTANKTAA